MAASRMATASCRLLSNAGWLRESRLHRHDCHPRSAVAGGQPGRDTCSITLCDRSTGHAADTGNPAITKADDAPLFLRQPL